MDLKLLARVGAVAFVALAIIVTAIQMRDHRHAAPADQPVSATAIADPLAAELGRCQAMGEAGANDRGCLAAWAENRRRFLAPDARSEATPTGPGGAR